MTEVYGNELTYQLLAGTLVWKVETVYVFGIATLLRAIKLQYTRRGRQ